MNPLKDNSLKDCIMNSQGSSKRKPTDTIAMKKIDKQLPIKTIDFEPTDTIAMIKIDEIKHKRLQPVFSKKAEPLRNLEVYELTPEEGEPTGVVITIPELRKELLKMKSVAEASEKYIVANEYGEFIGRFVKDGDKIKYFNRITPRVKEIIKKNRQEKKEAEKLARKLQAQEREHNKIKTAFSKVLEEIPKAVSLKAHKQGFKKTLKSLVKYVAVQEVEKEKPKTYEEILKKLMEFQGLTKQKFEELADTLKAELYKKTVKGYSKIFKIKNSAKYEVVRDGITVEYPILEPMIFRNASVRVIDSFFSENKNLRFKLIVNVAMYDKKNENFIRMGFDSIDFIINNSSEILESVESALQQILKRIEAYFASGSGLVLENMTSCMVNLVKYIPLTGSSYIELPQYIQKKNSTINIKNEDNKCFLWSLLANLHKLDSKKYKVNDVKHYQKYEKELDCDGFEFPMKIKDIKKFEKRNDYSINVIGYETSFNNDTKKMDYSFYPIHSSKYHSESGKEADLLYIDDKEGNSHYVLIKNISRLLSNEISKHNGEGYFCRHCLHMFTTEALLEKHKENGCILLNECKPIMPAEGETIKFTNINRMIKNPFVIYADFESLTKPIEKDETATKSTVKFQKHEPCGVAFKVVSQYPELYDKPLELYRGEKPAEWLLERLIDVQNEIFEIINNQPFENVEDMEITPEEEEIHHKATHCYICQKKFEKEKNDKVRDHDHFNGKYRGPAHTSCNLRYRINPKDYKIPVIFHNLKNYDGHILIKAMASLSDEYIKTIKCIPSNFEKYITFSIKRLTFIDSFAFLSTSLEKQVEFLAKEGLHKFKYLKEGFGEDNINILTKKGVYPYDYMNSWERFNEEKIPPKRHFYSQLTKSNISKVDYRRAYRTFKIFKCKNLGDYHDLYLKTDVLLLADVFENFRNVSLNYYQLDPVHYLTVPGLAWDAMLLITDKTLTLISDLEKHMFIERGLRGGISLICNRYAKANNPYLKKKMYDKREEKSYIMYEDANNLYGWAMIQKLPYKILEWLDAEKFDPVSFNADGDLGCIVEVDLEYPKELHDSHKDYPLAPEKLTVSEDMLSPVQKQWLDTLGLKHTKTEKLVPNLMDKKNYVCHIKNLQLYISLGLKVKKIHRVLSFEQSDWLKKYIDFNTDKRKHAKNDFEKDFFKLMNNSVFGKTMENVRHRVNINLRNEEQLVKDAKKPHFKNHKIYDENLIAVEMEKVNVKLNKPIYVGFSILELSKTLMYDFHYNTIKAKYGDKATLLFTDTDSLCYHIKTDDIYKDLKDIKGKFDFSNYPKDHFCFSDEYETLVGFFKDETKGKPILEFCGLRSKLYSVKVCDGKEKKVAKGVQKRVINEELTHQNYYLCLHSDKLEDMKQNCSFNLIRSFDHNISSMTVSKTSLCLMDDKKFYLGNTQSLPYGHYSIKN